jgi:hypothetical protein
VGDLVGGWVRRFPRLCGARSLAKENPKPASLEMFLDTVGDSSPLSGDVQETPPSQEVFLKRSATEWLICMSEGTRVNGVKER